MATTAENLADPELLQTEWDLEPLVYGEGEAGVDRLLSETTERAGAFAERYAGKLETIESSELERAMLELAEIQDMMGRAASYAALLFSTDTADPARGALLQRTQERATEIETKLLFFDLEWAALDDARAEELLADEGLEFCRHHLRSARRYRPHLLTEPEEKILSEKSISSESAWGRLFGELVSALRVELGEDEVTLDVALSHLQDSERSTRRSAAEAVSAALEPGLRTRGFIYNTLAHD